MQSWQTWGFNHVDFGFVSQRASQKIYVSLDAKMYKEHLEAQLKQSRCQRIKELVTNVQVNSAHCNIHLESKMLTAATVVDTRPPRIPKTTLKQQFWGTTIDLSRPHGISAPVLMDFDVKPIARDGISFMYVLPLSSSQLLVEATTFSTQVQPEKAYRDCVGQWLKDNLSMELRGDDRLSEAGTLPMGPTMPIEPKLINCGLAGGAARASTGYAFVGTERQTDRIVSQFLSGIHPRTQTPYSARANWMDEVFLQVAKQQPERLVELFMAMAQHLSGDDFAHFLSDTGGWMPCWRTVRVAPKLPFMRAAAQTLWARTWT
jgi:lycopene beta-cyclase